MTSVESPASSHSSHHSLSCERTARRSTWRDFSTSSSSPVGSGCGGQPAGQVGLARRGLGVHRGTHGGGARHGLAHLRRLDVAGASSTPSSASSTRCPRSAAGRSASASRKSSASSFSNGPDPMAPMWAAYRRGRWRCPGAGPVGSRAARRSVGYERTRCHQAVSTQRSNLRPTSRSVPTRSKPTAACSASLAGFGCGDDGQADVDAVGVDPRAAARRRAPAQTATPRVGGEVDRRLAGAVVGRARTVGRGIRHAHDPAAAIGDDDVVARAGAGHAVGEAARAAAARRRTSRPQWSDGVVVDVRDGRQVGGGRGAQDHRLGCRARSRVGRCRGRCGSAITRRRRRAAARRGWGPVRRRRAASSGRHHGWGRG